MIALVAPKLEVAFLESLDDKELLCIPVVVIFLKEASEGPLVSPFNTDPFQCLLLTLLHNLILDGQLAVNIVFDLLN